MSISLARIVNHTKPTGIPFAYYPYVHVHVHACVCMCVPPSTCTCMYKINVGRTCFITHKLVQHVVSFCSAILRLSTLVLTHYPRVHHPHPCMYIPANVHPCTCKHNAMYLRGIATIPYLLYKLCRAGTCTRFLLAIAQQVQLCRQIASYHRRGGWVWLIIGSLARPIKYVQLHDLNWGAFNHASLYPNQEPCNYCLLILGLK